MRRPSGIQVGFMIVTIRVNRRKPGTKMSDEDGGYDDIGNDNTFEDYILVPKPNFYLSLNFMVA